MSKTPGVRFNLAQRIVVVVALGFILLAVGQWVVASNYPGPDFGWVGYAPLTTTHYVFGSGLSTSETFLLWLGLAAVWTLLSLAILRSRRRKADATGTTPDEPPAR